MVAQHHNAGVGFAANLMNFGMLGDREDVMTSIVLQQYIAGFCTLTLY
jgi:hypothetical protein